jgi:hypothetical protein
MKKLILVAMLLLGGCAPGLQAIAQPHHKHSPVSRRAHVAVPSAMSTPTPEAETGAAGAKPSIAGRVRDFFKRHPVKWLH